MSSSVATHSVGIVGGRGAGKTTYLATLYHKLAFQPADVGFYLEAPTNQAKQLVGMFSTLAGHEWIPPTGIRIGTWHFTLGVMASQKGWEACKFEYYDYGGGLIDSDDPQVEQQASELAHKLAQCQAIIALLDGAKISNFVTGEDQKAKIQFVQHDLRNIIRSIADATKLGNLRSLQFVITKWDYVQKTGQGLNDIAKLLQSLNYFADFMNMIPPTRAKIESQQRNASSEEPVRTIPIVRLIPISAVGFNFVEGFSQEQGMIINSQAQPEPWNVAAPLACAFVDIIKAELEAVQKKREATEAEKYSSAQSNWDWLKHYAITTGLKYIPRKWTNNNHMFSVLKSILEEHAYSIQEDEDARYRSFNARKEASLKQIKDNESAFFHAADMCVRIEQQFDRDFPGNVIQ